MKNMAELKQQVDLYQKLIDRGAVTLNRIIA